LLQYLTTCITCLVLAFTRSWALTLVILSAVPLLTFVQALSQSLANPLLASERSESATAATLVDRALASISTVKAFNAAPFEQRTLDKVLNRLNRASKKLNAVWGAMSASAQVVSMAMFVQGFWFGSKLVRDGKIGAGDVMAVFWACLIATSNLQMCIPQFFILAKGKFAVVALLSLVDDPHINTTAPAPSPAATSSGYTLSSLSSRSVLSNKRPFTSTPTHLRKIIPKKNCTGEFALSSISFSYPTRPSIPVLADISLYLPAHELTFIVGSSGSGKSTIAQLLLRMYQPQGGGTVLLDDTELRYLDPSWVRGNVCGVGQGMGDVVLEGKSILENIALGVEGATEEMVEEACRAALFHEFVRDLSDGYETILGGGGAAGVALSGGQKQRLAIARARLRNPSVLVLG
jgi:ATP-binding cassette subfamily B (MDR/TAP) protein 1